MQSSDFAEFRAVLQKSKRIVAIAGAGLSAASGLPTFWNGGGLWRSYDVKKLATPGSFATSPSRVWQFYHMRREMALKAAPNAAHIALAKLSLPECLQAIAPQATFTLVTQNVDGLSTRALDNVRGEAEDNSESSPAIFEMHGKLLETICIECGHREANFDSPICPSLAGTELIVKNHKKEPRIRRENLPRCRKPECGGLLRPGVVWFGEMPHHLDEIDQLVEEADLGLIVGTSSTVTPASEFAGEIAKRGGKIAVFNLENTDEEADFLFLGPCEETLPLALFGDDAPLRRSARIRDLSNQGGVAPARSTDIPSGSSKTPGTAVMGSPPSPVRRRSALGLTSSTPPSPIGMPLASPRASKRKASVVDSGVCSSLPAESSEAGTGTGTGSWASAKKACMSNGVQPARFNQGLEDLNRLTNYLYDNYSNPRAPTLDHMEVAKSMQERYGHMMTSDQKVAVADLIIQDRKAAMLYMSLADGVDQSTWIVRELRRLFPDDHVPGPGPWPKDESLPVGSGSGSEAIDDSDPAPQAQ